MAGEGDPKVAPVVEPPKVPPPGDKPWFDTFKDEPTKLWLTSLNNAYPDAESLAVKAYNLEKFVGAEKAGRGVVVPKPDAPAEEWQAFTRKVYGAPDKADGYALPKDLDPKVAAEISADPLIAKFREHAVKTAMPPSYFSEVIRWYTSEMGGLQNAQYAEFERKSEQDVDALKKDWGGEYDKNIEIGKRAAKTFVKHANPAELQTVLTKIEGALGTRAMLEFFTGIGKGLTEHGFVLGEGGGAGGLGGGMDAASARLKIKDLQADPAFAAKIITKDAEATAEWTRLHKIAYPEPA